MLDQAFRLFSECALLRGLTLRQKETLFACVRIGDFGAGETIFLKGAPGENMMAVLEGNVRISVISPDGQTLVLAILFPGDVFGEIAVLDGRRRTADATAKTACRLAILDRSDILAFLDCHPGAWTEIMSVLCDHLRRTSEQLAEITLLELPARLAKALLRMTGPVVHSEPDAQKIRIQQRELGNIVGASREAVNKQLSNWQQRRIIAIKGTLITILNRSSLEELAKPP
jgi:CRP/FNR family transcriptional regulator, cyclic AMP receptor protein